MQEIPAALDTLVAPAITHYGRWAHGNPVMLVHAATAPRTIALARPTLPREMWLDSYNMAVTAVISSAYRFPDPPLPTSAAEHAITSAGNVAELAVASRDEHAIKLTEVAHESHRRGNTAALPSAMRAVTLITST